MKRTGAASDADFINKMRIALKEANETEYWLTVLSRTGYYDKSFDAMAGLIDECKRMIISSIKTVNKRIEEERQAEKKRFRKE